MPRHTPIYIPLENRSRPLRRRDDRKPTLHRSPVRVLRWMALLAMLGLLFVGIQNAYPALTDSGLFRLEQISVVGNRLLAPGEVLARSGLEVGVNLFEADLYGATEKLASHPLIRDVLLLRQPPGELVISVEERRPLALVSTPEGIRALDREGTLFEPPQAGLDLPVVTGIEAAHTDSSGSRGLALLVDFVETLRANAPGFWNEVSEVHVESPAEVCVYTVGDGLKLRMRLAEAGAQVRSFEAYRASGIFSTTAPAYVDLRFRNQVVVGKK